MCLAFVSFAHVNESGFSMQMPSVLISALTGCLSFNGLLQILPAHSSSPKHFLLLFLSLLLLGVFIKSVFISLFSTKGVKIKPDVI